MLRLEKLRKSYPGFELEASLEVGAGQTLALLGPSGSGKSTLLRLVAGLETPDSGQVWLGQTNLTALPTEQRGVGMVFQDYALFPHLSVAENIAFGLREAHWERARAEARVEELLELTHLGPHRGKRPGALSGGERQRVALARALANLPRVLLLDEPLGALDLKLREELLYELRAILRQTAIPTLVVTHDQSEAFILAQQVAVMREGRTVQVDSPERLYHHPKDLWTAHFLGHRNIFSSQTSLGLGLRPQPHLLPPGSLELGSGEEAEVLDRIFMGARVGLWLGWRGIRLYWEGRDTGLAVGQSTQIRVDLSRAVPLRE